MNTKKILLTGAIIVVLAIIAGGASYWYGDKVGYKRGDSDGYKRAEADIKKIQEETAKKSAEALTKAANPFSGANPLEGIDANPFEKTKKILNPFQ